MLSTYSDHCMIPMILDSNWIFRNDFKKQKTGSKRCLLLIILTSRCCYMHVAFVALYGHGWCKLLCFFFTHILFACFFSGKPCEATWHLFSLVASAFDVVLFGPVVPVVFGVTWLMALQNYNENSDFKPNFIKCQCLR
jgi:hypothetical protein